MAVRQCFMALSDEIAGPVLGTAGEVGVAGGGEDGAVAEDLLHF